MGLFYLLETIVVLMFAVYCGRHKRFVRGIGTRGKEDWKALYYSTLRHIPEGTKIILQSVLSNPKLYKFQNLSEFMNI